MSAIGLLEGTRFDRAATIGRLMAGPFSILFHFAFFFFGANIRAQASPSKKGQRRTTNKTKQKRTHSASPRPLTIRACFVQNQKLVCPRLDLAGEQPHFFFVRACACFVLVI